MMTSALDSENISWTKIPAIQFRTSEMITTTTNNGRYENYNEISKRRTMHSAFLPIRGLTVAKYRLGRYGALFYKDIKFINLELPDDIFDGISTVFILRPLNIK